MKYISLFTGVGGLEDSTEGPVSYCEKDPASRQILSRLFPGAQAWDDVETYRPPRVDVVAGGWPCQDLTPAGRMAGLSGSRSSLFFRMVDIAARAHAHTVVGENVPNLIHLRQGRDFLAVLQAFIDNGYSTVAWRTLDAQQFGLPQHRPRLYFVASKHKEIAFALHRRIPSDGWGPATNDRSRVEPRTHKPLAAGFYWTGGGSRSICYSAGCTPALKVGSAKSQGTSPVAVFYGNTVRKLSSAECLGLQGFSGLEHLFVGQVTGEILRMAGNAVPRPVGQFVMASISQNEEMAGSRTGFDTLSCDGICADGVRWKIEHDRGPHALNLIDFLNINSSDSLSPQAAAGLLTRLIRSNRRVPLELFDVLYALSLQVTHRLKGTKINSFDILHKRMDAGGYRAWIASQMHSINTARLVADSRLSL